MNNPRIMNTAIFVLLFACSVSAQKHELETEQQILLQPIERITSDSLVGAAIEVNNASLLVNFTPTPSSAYCGAHCVARGILRVQLAVSGNAGQYLGGRQVFTCPLSVEITGVNGTLRKWILNGNPYGLAASNSTSVVAPEQDLIVDVTTHSPIRCTGSDSTSTSIKVRVCVFDTTGIPLAILDSLILRATLIEEFSDSPYPSSTISCSGTPMIKTDSAYISNPVTLKWTVGSCPDKFPMYEVNVLRLKNKNAAYRDNPNRLKDTVHWEKAQRLFAYGYADRITLTIAEGTGYYVWRVRPIGNYYSGGMANDSNWGCWSVSAVEDEVINFSGTDSASNVSVWKSAVSGRGVSMFYYKQFDADKNWQFGRVFVEGKDGRGGIAENMTYATTLLLPVQKQSPVPST